MVLLYQFCYPAEFSFQGQLSYENHSYLSDLKEPTRAYDHIFHLAPELEVSGQKDRLVFKSHFRGNLSTEITEEQSFHNIQEAYWEYKNYPLRFRAGVDTYNWGTVDGYSPLDVANSKAFFNPLAAEKLGSPGLNLQLSWDSWRFEIFYIHQQRDSILPSADSRWLPREFLSNVSAAEATILLPSQFNYQYQSIIQLDNALKNNFGFRLGGRFSDFDFGLIHIDGMSVTPHLRLEITTSGTPISLDPLILQATSDVLLTPVFFRQRTTGFHGAWAPGSIIFKLEAAYTDVLTKQNDIPNWAIQYVAGIEKPISFFNKSLTFLFQYYHGKSDDLSENLISAGNRIFDNSALLALLLSLNSSSSLRVSALEDFNNDSGFYNLTLNVSLGSGWDVRFAVDVLEGKEDSLLGSYRSNDRFQTQLGFRW